MIALVDVHTPSAVVTRIDAHGVAETAHRLVKLLGEYVLLSEQSVRVRELGINLYRAL